MEEEMDDQSNLEIIEEDDKEQTQVWSNIGGTSIQRRNMETPGTNIITQRDDTSAIKQRADDEIDIISQPQQDGKENEENKQSAALLQYNGEEDDIICGRFPHLDVCGCEIPSFIALKEIKLIEVIDGVFMGPFQAAFKTRELLENNVTHILNLSTREFTKRKFFKYLDINIYDNHTEDARKYFRITNRFIKKAKEEGGKVLVSCIAGKSRSPTFILAYLIGVEKVKLKDGLALLRQFVPEVEPNDAFIKQLQEYDLEILSKY
ncbi:unnamed protein product [Moneuplotes crassus]|uniref:protein-tyrosine-phosphatase n=1 Tax=Euplotes crassus TaxID=5936 RepID=A0AAD1XV92_EUPCR|nr:unnamed protein product [Moneuplotes crassus]